MFTGADGKIAWQGQLLKLNPFTHLAITYQEILFFNGPVGHLKLLLAAWRHFRGVLLVVLLGVRPAAGYLCGRGLKCMSTPNFQLPTPKALSTKNLVGSWELEVGS